MVKTEIVKIQSDPSRRSMSSSASASRNKKKYKGVRMRSWGSWVSEIRAPNQKTRIWLGSYSTAEAAARAYDAALLCLKGSSANLNFPLSQSPSIPDTTMSPKSIQRVAAAAAAAANASYESCDNFDIGDNGATINPSTTIANAAAAATTATTTSFSPPLSSTSSASSPTSPSPSSSSSNQNDDIDASSTNSVPYCPSYYTTSTTNATYDGHYTEELMRPSMDPWIDLGDLQSPKYMDHVLNASAMFNMPSIDDFYEGGDLSLWSFC